MKLAFISDLHLSPETFNNNQLFYGLIKKWQIEVDALYILGDFFDYWLGDDDDNIFIREMKSVFKEFTQLKPIYFIGGNHDFALGKKFAAETGITRIPDLTTIAVGPNRILLSHGDAFCTLDIAYQKMKWILQNKFIVWLLLKTPLSLRYKIKEKLENKSSAGFNTKSPETYLVVDETIAEIAHKQNANVVIHGHTHLPNRYSVKSPYRNDLLRFEIPDWTDRNPGGYILVDGTKIKIHIPN